MRCGVAAVAGRPNVGKSTLVNALCGEKIAITSKVPNTTRRRLFGVAHGADYQLALVDLPGFQRPMDPLTERMQQTVDASFDDVDAVCEHARQCEHRVSSGFVVVLVDAVGDLDGPRLALAVLEEERIVHTGEDGDADRAVRRDHRDEHLLGPAVPAVELEVRCEPAHHRRSDPRADLARHRRERAQPP